MISADVFVGQFNSTVNAPSLVMSKNTLPFGDSVRTFSASSFCSNGDAIRYSFFTISFVGLSKRLSIMLWIVPVSLLGLISFKFYIFFSTLIVECSEVFRIFLSEVAAELINGLSVLAPIFLLIRADLASIFSRPFILTIIYCVTILLAIILGPFLAFFTIPPTTHLRFFLFANMRTLLQLFLVGIELLSIAIYPSHRRRNKSFRMGLRVFSGLLASAWAAVRISAREVFGRLFDLTSGASLSCHALDSI